ncbi:MAG: ATPase [Desulfopila sp.]
MRGVNQAARLMILAMLALCVVMGTSLAIASSGGGAATHAPSVQGETPLEAYGEEVIVGPNETHGETAAGAHVAPDSLSAIKIKDLGLRIMNFAVLLFLVVKFGAKPIGNALAGRRKAIKEEIEDLEAKKTAAEKSYREFADKLASAEKDIDKVVDRALAQAEIEKAKIIEKAEQAAADIRRQAEIAIQQELMEARRTLKNEVADQAAVMAEELIVKNLTAEDQVRIVEEYLDKVGAVQ